ncbi:MAG TPA: phasin family protein [Lysobacter sp.]|nr:phasin family protein [Lysobacter sp.]
MYTINDQFAKASRQFADNAAEANRILLQNAENAFALQLATFEQNANAAFAFIGEVVEARDADALKTVLPKGLQVARESAERNVGAAQEVFGNSLKAGEAIGRIAKGQFEATAAEVQAEVGKASKAAAGKKAAR